MKFIIMVSLSATLVAALDNGVGLRPAMGFNSLYAFHSHLVNYVWEKDFVLADEVKATATFLKEKGFFEAGYTYFNLDDCIVQGRGADNRLIPDQQAFPNGVRPLADWLHSNGFKFGWYTDRGKTTCASRTTGVVRPGSLDHESTDAQTFAEWGIDYLKEDSCNDPHDPLSPLQRFALMRDALNATGRPIYFNMCWGAGKEVAENGRSYGNAWRIAEDDGSGWTAILVNVDVNAQLMNYSGCDNIHHDGHGCGWNDPGLLLVGANNLNDAQGKSQFNLWSIMASKLLISVDPRNMSETAIQTHLNREVIAVDQDPLGRQGWRAVQSVRGNGTVEVWLRPLVDRAFAVVFFNRQTKMENQTIVCDSDCFNQMGFTGPVNVRDLWAHKDIGTASGSISFADLGNDESAMLKLTPK